MAANTQNIKLGVCDVTFTHPVSGATDLGATKGGVEVEIKTESYQVKIDQFGETPVKDIITGTMVTVKVPMAETDLTRLGLMLPQSVSTPAVGGVPTTRTVDATGNLTVGSQTVKILGSAGTPPAVGMTMKFANHATVYKVIDATATPVLGIAPVNGGTGLQAAIVGAEAIVFTAMTGTVEIRSGVNTDLLAQAGQLKLHPSNLSGGNTAEDFTLFKAAPQPNFSFKYELAGERVYEVTFNGYPDIAANGRIAAFGA